MAEVWVAVFVVGVWVVGEVGWRTAETRVGEWLVVALIVVAAVVEAMVAL